MPKREKVGGVLCGFTAQNTPHVTFTAHVLNMSFILLERSLMDIDKNTIPHPNPDIIGRVVDNEAVLVMPQQGKVKVLNEVGAAIWELVDGQRSIHQIAEEICTQFEIDQATAEADTLKFIADLVEREMVTLSSN